MKVSKLLFISFPLICFILLTSSSIPTQVTVSGNVAWTKTEYTLKVGDILAISSSGESVVMPDIKCPPVGVMERMDLNEKFNVLKTANFGCLIGKIGENGEPFFVGDNLNIIANSNGVLYLGINDNDLKDNKGEFYSIVTITSTVDQVKGRANN